MMGLFKKPERGNAFLKAAIFGEQGSGKTHSASLIAIGLCKHLQRLKMPQPPVFFLDSETGSDWVKPMFDQAGVEFLVHKSRSFLDLKQAITEVDTIKGVLIVDSISHFWAELQKSFEETKRKRTGNRGARLEIQDWGTIKAQWEVFTQAFVNASAHVIILGRRAEVYESQVDEETNKKSMVAAGTRMAAEKGLGHESSLLIEMHSEHTGRGKTKKIQRIATVLKDRGRALDGQQFRNPVFQNLLPHVAQLNLGYPQVGIDTSRNSTTLFPRSDGEDRSNQRKIALDEIETLIILHHPGQTAAEKQAKTKLIRKHFDKASWTEISTVMSLERLREGYDSLHIELEGEPSRYHLKPPEELNDAIPAEFLGHDNG